MLHNGIALTERLVTGTMGKATLRAKEYTDKGDIHPEHRKRPHKHEETVLCTQILTVSSNTQLLLQTPSPFYNWIKPADRANSCRGPFRCVKSSSVICLVRTPSDIVSSTAAPLDSATTTALAKATITRSLLTDQSIILCGVILVSASVTIPFWQYTGSMWMRFMLKLNAKGGPTAGSNRPYEDVPSRRIKRFKAS